MGLLTPVLTPSQPMGWTSPPGRSSLAGQVLGPNSPQEDGLVSWYAGKVAKRRILGAGVGQAPEHPTNGGCL